MTPERDPDQEPDRDWDILVLPGVSGVGKTTAAATIARRFGVQWLEVDDLRQALQFSGAVLPAFNDELYYFLRTPNFAFRPVEEVVRGFVGTGKALIPALRVTIETHLVCNAPCVIEGDGVLPELMQDATIGPYVDEGRVRFCVITEDSVEALLTSMLGRGRGIGSAPTERAERHAHANAAYNAWLVNACREVGIPVVPSRPQETLADRVLAAVSRD